MKTNFFLICVLSAILALLSSLNLHAAGGPLNPPGPPGVTFKTLHEVEPRTPISSLPFVISQPGSYYLTTNLVGIAGQHGITVTGARVTIDLMGFELRGVPGSLSGIFLNFSANPHVRNGSIANWGQDGINGNNAGGGVIEDLRVFNNVRYGISFNSGSQIRKCVVGANGNVGILTSNDVEIDDCVSNGNGTHGIQAGTGSTIRRCLTVQNSAAGITGSGIDGLNIIECNAEFNGSGIATLGQTIVKDSFARSNTVAGIAVGPGSSIQGCNASDNGTNGISVSLGSTVQSCIAENNRGHGIVAANGSSIISCSARVNLADNIQVDGDCVVTGNACDNSSGLAGVGIHVLTSDNRIENNNLTDNRTGLRIDGGANYVANNTVRNNTTNYVIAQGNQLNILLGQLPQFVPWPATIKLAGTLTGIRFTNGITVASDDVTIDLSDHALVGVAQAINGIQVLGSRTNITVRNGSIISWPIDGVDAGTAVNSQLRNVIAARNGGSGILIGEGGLIEACSVRTNALTGIVASSGTRVVDCSASRNSTGISIGTGSSVSGSAAFDNAVVGITAAGFGGMVQNCSAYSNGTNGITSTVGGQIINCTSRNNAGNGIQVSGSCIVMNNNCTINAFNGILVTSTANRIDGNHCTGGQRGIDVNGVDNLIVRNSVQGASVLSYDIVAGNHNAAIVTSPGANFASTAPWANFSF